MTNPKCPSCGMILVLCENFNCRNSPHYICSDHGGCMHIVGVTAKELTRLKWEDVKNER